MSAQTKVDGIWRTVETPYVKVSGSWEVPKSAWVKVNSSWKTWFLQGGVLDAAFSVTTGTGVNSEVVVVAVQPDGKIIIAGSFTEFNGTTANRILRLNSDGTKDTAFSANVGVGPNTFTEIRSIGFQTDGKIILSGSFVAFNGQAAGRIVRLNTNGTLDTVFLANIGTGAANVITSMGVQSDNKIVIGGAFGSFNGITANRLARLNANGTPDTDFITNLGTGPSNQVEALAVQPDGKIIIAGWGGFTSFNGTAINQVLRLNADGTLDTAFTSNIGSGTGGWPIRAVVIQSNGKILIGGDFNFFNGTRVRRIVRLNADGTRDTAFTANTGDGVPNDTEIRSIAVQPDGKIIIAGSFTEFNGTTANRILRLNSDGTKDTAFSSNTGTGANAEIRSVAVQPDSKIVIGGSLTAFNSEARGRLCRVGGDLAA